MKEIDLRSDTVTKPTPAMREAMFHAEVGDSARGDDPTVDRLQELAAELLGKEAALYVPSGTMGNLLAHMAHCQYGDEVIVGHRTHTFVSEVGNAAAIMGLSFHTTPNEGPRMDPQAVEDAIRPEDEHFPRTALIWLENTHVISGGQVLSLEDETAICEVARRHSLPVHIDGARIFNAATYLGCDVKEIAKHVDSVMFCLSKGLAAPVGSMLVGRRDFIDRAIRNCKRIGGRMRQAGVIAAAGIVALEQMVGRLEEDHANAKLLAEGLSQIDGVSIDDAQVQTNIVFVDVDPELMTARECSQALASKGVRASPRNKSSLRMVTHYGIERQDVLDAVDILRDAIAQPG